MNIEYALYIIESTNYDAQFTNEEKNEAFDMAYRALKLFSDYKKEVKQLHLMKDHTAQAIAAIFDNEINKLEEGWEKWRLKN